MTAPGGGALEELSRDLGTFLSAERGSAALESLASAALGVVARSRAIAEGRVDRALLDRRLRFREPGLDAALAGRLDDWPASLLEEVSTRV